MKTGWIKGECLDLSKRLLLRPLRADYADGLCVSAWRNTFEARQAFFSSVPVTPETHMRFMAQKSPLDLIWMLQDKQRQPEPANIGMVSLTLREDASAEYGRLWVVPEVRALGYGIEAELVILALAFEFFNLRTIWAEVLVSNAAALRLHDKTGWQRIGCDVEGHCNARCAVELVTYERATWRARRTWAQEIAKLDLGDWSEE
jgi:RimJ/RimL family protein N-acetyltransferase